jgi:hypothetical protein
MVVVRLYGGVGNQMFQYAAGRCLAHRRGEPLYLETSLLPRPAPTPREYGLDIFSLRPRFTTLAALVPNVNLLISIRQCERGYYEDVLNCSAKGAIVLDGYWQSEAYFAEIGPLLRREFIFRRRGLGGHRAPTTGIRSPASVAVHVRRGDYLLTRRLRPLRPSYYRRAAEYMAGQIDSPHFYVFSDDLDWCRRNLRLEHPHTFVLNAGSQRERAATDLQAMSSCRHFIIANSSFSWWAAWLGTKPGTKVVAPREWLTGDTRGSRAIVPRRWMRL